MTQKKTAWLLMVNVPVDQDRLVWKTKGLKNKFKRFFTINKQERILNKVEDAAEEFMMSDPSVQKYVGNVMSVYVDNYYDKVWPAILNAKKTYNEKDYYEFLLEMSALYNTYVGPLVASANQNMNTVSEWAAKAYGDAHAYFAEQFGLELKKAQEEQEWVQEGAQRDVRQPQPATASVGHLFASVDPRIDFNLRTAWVPIPFPIVWLIDTDDPHKVRLYKKYMPVVQPIMTIINDSLKKRSKKKKDRKHEQIREQDVQYLANKWARKEVNENSQIQSLASSVYNDFLMPLQTGKGNLKKARWLLESDKNPYGALRHVVYAYMQTFGPIVKNIDSLIAAMKQADAIYKAHIKHFGEYVANGGKLPKIASVQDLEMLRVGRSVYRLVPK